MALSLDSLDEQTRQFMLNEVEHDLANEQLYISPRLNPQGRIAYPELLKRATLLKTMIGLLSSCGSAT